MDREEILKLMINAPSPQFCIIKYKIYDPVEVRIKYIEDFALVKCGKAYALDNDFLFLDKKSIREDYEVLKVYKNPIKVTKQAHEIEKKYGLFKPYGLKEVQQITAYAKEHGLKLDELEREAKEKSFFLKYGEQVKINMNHTTKAREELVKMYVDALKREEIPWRKGWDDGSPYNPTSKTKYRGINSLLLAISNSINQYSDPRWATFSQIKKNNWHLKKGSVGQKIEIWKIWNIETKEWMDVREYNKRFLETPEDEKETFIKKHRWAIKTYTVFNYSCIEGVPKLEQKAQFKDDQCLNEICETMSNNMNLVVEHGYTKACYKPSLDKVCLPDKLAFNSLEDYYSTRLHEVAHASGHETRLNRNMNNGFGTEDYAREELIAEIASSFMMADLNVDGSTEQYDNHAAYIQSWIQVIENEPEELFKAIDSATKVADYCLDKSNYLEIMKEYEQQKDVQLEQDFQQNFGMEMSL